MAKKNSYIKIADSILNIDDLFDADNVPKKILMSQVSLEPIIDYTAIKENQTVRIVEDEAIEISIALEGIRSILDSDSLEIENKTLLFSMINHISSYATQDPNKVHYDNVRSEIENIKEEVKAKNKGNIALINALDDPSTIDRLARELVEFCKRLKIKLLDNLTDGQYESDGMFIWDKTYLDVLKTYGKEGGMAVQQLKPACQSMFEEFKTKKIYSYDQWINQTSQPNKPFHLSKFLKIFVSVVWEEIIKSKVNFAANNPPGTTTNVTSSLSKILHPTNSIITTEEELQLRNNKNIKLGSTSIATFDTRMIEKLVLNGVTELSSLTAIKFICYLIRETYNQFISGNPKYSSIEVPGRARQIAKTLNLKSNQDATTINDLVFMFDNIKFTLPGIISRLIAVSDCKPNSRYSAKGGWIITVLPPLLPQFVHTDKGTFIIPLLKEPPLVTHKKFHAAQYILQWKVIEEFSNQSTQLAQHGCIVISKKMWIDWLFNLGIPEQHFQKIHEAITGVTGYLEYKGSNYYTLKNEDKSLKFLKAQGNLRIAGSKGGKTTARKKRQYQKSKNPVT